MLQIIGEKSVLACVMLVAACMYEGLCVCVFLFMCWAFAVHTMCICCTVVVHVVCMHNVGM